MGVGGRADQVRGVEENAKAIVDLRDGIRGDEPVEAGKEKAKRKGRKRLSKRKRRRRTEARAEWREDN